MVAGYLTIAQAAAQYRLDRHRLQKAALAGRLHGRKASIERNAPWLVRPAAIERYLRVTRFGPKPRPHSRRGGSRQAAVAAA